MTIPAKTPFGRYKIDSLLGSGGMGEVYLATDPELGRNVAIKMLTDACCEDSDRLGRFIREARSASALNHPNIITIYEFGKHDDHHFMATEFIDGRELSDILAYKQLSPEEALEIAIQVASALASAHRAGIIHRDIKPGNIMVRRDGIVKVLDFGLAKLTVLERGNAATERIGPDEKTLIAVSPAGSVSSSSDTIPGLVMGTPKYMSPEQARGIEIDHQTDIFSLGVVIYEMLTGTQPFDGETVSDIIARVLTRNPPRILEVNRGLPQKLDAIVDKTLRKDKNERYKTADDLLADLSELKQDLQLKQHLDRIEETSSSLRFIGVDSGNTPATKGSRISIAVIPIVNMSADEKGRDYFSEGLTEEIITNLSKLERLSVVARGTIMGYVNEGKSHKRMADDLGVQYLLEGSVRRQGMDLRITAQLVDTFNQAYLWSETYRGTVKDIFEIQEKVALEIVRALEVRLSPDEEQQLKKRYTENTEAYQLYLQGRFFWNKRSEDGIRTAIRYFEKAIEIDDQYALAWAGIADSYSLLAEYGTVPRRILLPKAEAAIQKALEADDGLAEAHTSKASLLMLKGWDWEGARREFERALELDPNYATAHHWYALWFLGKGNTEEAMRRISRAAELDPVSQAIIKDKGNVLYHAGQFDAAIELALKTLELDPDFPAAHRLLSLCYQTQGLYEKAIAENERWGQLTGNTAESNFALARIYAVSGNHAEARKLAEEVEKDSSGVANVFRGLALVYAGLGKDEKAFEMLEKSIEKHEEALLNLKVDPKLERLRPDPRFKEMLKKIGIEE